MVGVRVLVEVGARVAVGEAVRVEVGREVGVAWAEGLAQPTAESPMAEARRNVKTDLLRFNVHPYGMLKEARVVMRCSERPHCCSYYSVVRRGEEYAFIIKAAGKRERYNRVGGTYAIHHRS